MSVRVVARIRPLLKSELEKDSIVEAANNGTVVKIPNPKTDKESFSFQFNSVYERQSTQQELFDGEVAPTVKHLFNGFDVTIFAYGVTGTGKTHTMRGGKTLSDRGVIPRMLSSIYRRRRKIERDSGAEKKVVITLSYYEIYNDKVFDLFEPPEKRTLAGLPIRDNNGKTVVAGLTERPCTTLKDFETLYDEANVHRSTGATKLNLHSSRSHAVLCVKIAQITGNSTVISTASAIDLAGSEDNRRTDNDKERLVESSSINRSLFVLAQCVEAISKKQARIPYRESKLTRILSLGQNNGLTIMILNLAPVRSYHLDTLSSLNFANRTKKIEVREIENEPIFKGLCKQTSTLTGPAIQRQPLRPVPFAANIGLKAIANTNTAKPTKSFAVYSEKSGSGGSSLKRGSTDNGLTQSTRPTKSLKPTNNTFLPNRTAAPIQGLSRQNIEALVNRMVDEKLANRKLASVHSPPAPPALDGDVQRRLAALEERIIERREANAGNQSGDGEGDSRAEGLQYLLMAKQHKIRGDNGAALKMYQLAVPYFPDNSKLRSKMCALQQRLRAERTGEKQVDGALAKQDYSVDDEEGDGEYEEHSDEEEEEASVHYKPRPKKHATTTTKFKVYSTKPPTELTPRSKRILDVINTRDLGQIRELKGVGVKRAEMIVGALCEMAAEGAEFITDLEMLGGVKGIGAKAVENMRCGVAA